ncbi:SEC-C domain-containing protein [Agrobacterium rhizogenes]|nr:SEC-C domain-containing protein [Rhizobium rhizogenes]
MRIGRNQTCPCGSGKKYKRCHGSFAEPVVRTAKLQKIHEFGKRQPTKAGELLRIQQQGMGKQIESFQIDSTRFVIAGDQIYRSERWQTFIDFLCDYILDKFGRAWAKSEHDRCTPPEHPLLTWFVELRKLHSDTPGEEGGVRNLPLTGAAMCFFGLAYNLYLLQHNVELQERYLARLRNIGNFQGAYYELIVASVLIQAGFRLELEDETDGTAKHCEFSAISPSGRKFWVEAKSRSVAGILGKSSADGISKSVRDPTTRLTKHLNDALEKPAADERLIFIDLNAPHAQTESGEPFWLNSAVQRLDARERTLSDGQTSYIFVTNLPYHRYLDAIEIGREVLAFGLGISDFSKPGHKTIVSMYRAKQKHLDAHRIMDELRSYPRLPSTFDGSLPSQTFGGSLPPIAIGQTYFFDSIGDAGAVAKVTTAVMFPDQKRIMIGVSTEDGQHLLLSEDATDEQVADYLKHPDVYFGEIQNVTRQAKTPLELFEFFLETYSKSSKEDLLKFMNSFPQFEALRSLPQEELALIYCEQMTIAAVSRSQPELLRFGLPDKQR